MDVHEAHRRFGYHQPDEERKRAHEATRGICMSAATQLDALLPEGREKSLALTKIEEAMFWGNAAIARESK